MKHVSFNHLELSDQCILRPSSGISYLVGTELDMKQAEGRIRWNFMNTLFEQKKFLLCLLLK